MKAVIVDDEPLARDLIRRLLAAHADVEIVGEAGDVAAAVRTITSARPDVVFLDIELPGGNGFEILAGLPAPPNVVFVTAHEGYAVRAFAVSALDYLCKPFDDERLASSLARVRARLRPQTRFAIRDGDTTTLVPIADIECIEAAGKHIIIYAAGASHQSRETLTACEQRLDPERFVRIHRSAIVNLDHVRVVKPWFAGDQQLTLTSGKTLTTGRGFRDRLLSRLSR